MASFRKSVCDNEPMWATVSVNLRKETRCVSVWTTVSVCDDVLGVYQGKVLTKKNGLLFQSILLYCLNIELFTSANKQIITLGSVTVSVKTASCF